MMNLAALVLLAFQEPEILDSESGILALGFRASAWWNRSSGQIRATEFQSPAGGGRTLVGTELDLEDDFDLGMGATGEVAAFLDLTPVDRVELRFLFQDSDWTTSLERDILFNETSYDAETRLTSRLRHWQWTLSYRRELLDLPIGDGSFGIAAEGGVSYDHLTFRLRSPDKPKGEDFNDEIVPVLALALGFRAGSFWEAGLRIEQGIDLVSFNRFSDETRWTRLDAAITMTPGRWLSVSIGYRVGWFHSEFFGVEPDKTSNTGDNELDLRQEGPMFALEIRF